MRIIDNMSYKLEVKKVASEKIEKKLKIHINIGTLE